MYLSNRIATCAIVLLVFCGNGITKTSAENWPVWRGPQQNGVSKETNLPVRWSPTENVMWKFALPGAAPSTPVIWDDHIFLTSTSRSSDELFLICLNTEGKQLWQKLIGHGSSEQSEKNNLASPSPSTDGKHVWTMTGNGTLACHDFSGNRKWMFNIEDRYETIDMPWGLGSSPLPHGRLLFVQLFHLASSRIIALDKLTGAEKWTVERPTDAEGKCMRSYATPTIYRDQDRECLLTHGQDYIVAHDLKNGREFWRCGGFHPASGYDPLMHQSSSPVVAEQFILVPSATNGNFQVLRGGGNGDITGNATYQLWSQRISPYISSALLMDSAVYIWRNKGVLLCLDANTGESHFKRAVHRHSNHASPVCGDGKIYLASQDGTVTVVRAATEFQILATNHLDEPMSASPAVSGGRIYLRTFESLYAIGG